MATALLLVVLGAYSYLRLLGSEVPVSGVEWVQTAAGPVAIDVDPESQSPPGRSPSHHRWRKRQERP